jgi:hypothetical protein
VHIPFMDAVDESIRRVMKLLGARGGRARAKAMTPEQRRKSAAKASKAAAEARQRKARFAKAMKTLDHLEKKNAALAKARKKKA